MSIRETSDKSHHYTLATAPTFFHNIVSGLLLNACKTVEPN